jgi:hypothetical protein
MSAEAVGYVYRHSPYNGATFAIHLAIADTVSDQNHNQFWMSTAKLANKTRTTRRTVQKAIDQLCEDFFIVETRAATQHYPSTYRFLMPAVDIVYETHSGAQSVHPEAQSTTSRGATSTPKPNRTQKPKHSCSPDGEAFDQWWKLYPKKLNKENARKAWKAHTKKTKPETIIEATRKQLAAPNTALSTEPQYIPYPASWLNSGGYNNEYETSSEPARQYDQPTHHCDRCDSTRHIINTDNKGRTYAHPCPECNATL